MKYRKEKDTMGTILVPENAYYGPQTQLNQELGLLDSKLADAITAAAQEVVDGQFGDQFVVNVFQTGSGTSTNMNMNEVVACRANEIITGKKSGKSPVHPNDHVNLGQSSNDVIPSVIHIAALMCIREHLVPSLNSLQQSLAKKAKKFVNIHKIGRTHLQDAVPMLLGQEFSGYARQIELGIKRIDAAEARLRPIISKPRQPRMPP
jgi:fumarate hydratase class II